MTIRDPRDWSPEEIKSALNTALKEHPAAPTNSPSYVQPMAPATPAAKTATPSPPTPTHNPPASASHPDGEPHELV